MVAAGVADQVLIQVAYAIGVAQPVGLYVNTFGTARVKDKKGNILADGTIAEKINKIFDMRPYAIVERFGLKNPIYQPTASYGHFGRDFYTKEVEVFYPVKGSKAKKVNGNGKEVYTKKVDFFAWEKLDYADKLRKEFGI
jgi:S-adenosylmethionine synthetase